MPKRWTLIGGLIALLIGSAAHAQETVWRHGITSPKGDAGILYMAADQGFDKQQGIKIEITALKGDAMLTKALLSGELDSYEGNPGGPMLAAAKGADLRVLGCTWPGLPYAIYTKPGIKSVADLKGRSIAVSDPGALPDLFARAVLRAGGLDPDKDATYMRAGSDADRIKALVAGVVDVAPSSIEFSARAPQLGLKVLALAKDVTPEYPRFCIITTGKVLAAKRKAAAAFMAAEMQGMAYAVDHEAETLALSAKVTGTKADNPDARFIYAEVKKGGLVDATLPLDPKQIFYVRDLLTADGLLAKGFDPSPMIDASVREAALGLVKSR